MPPILDVVVFGATGFTGRLVAEHLFKSYGQGNNVRWAMAGRSIDKLESLRTELASKYSADASSVDILVADAYDRPSLDAIASSTKVLISTAGPFAISGAPVVDACVSNGCDYVDITGEVPFIAAMAAKHHDACKDKGVKVIHCCGYDSVPSDIGTLAIVRRAKELGKSLSHVTTIVGDSKGGVSGGTIASGMNLMADPELRKADMSMYAYIPAGETKGHARDLWSPQYCNPAQRWLAPFVMAAVNTRVVQRSNYLLNYGKENFTYAEHLGTTSWWMAATVSAATALIGLVIRQPWLHPIVKRMVPKQGEGPSRETMMNGYYNHQLVGVCDDGDIIMGTFSDRRDPGYWGTSRLLLEAALCLALDRKALDACPEVLKGGVLTPAAGLGVVYMQRLAKAGVVCLSESGTKSSK